MKTKIYYFIICNMILCNLQFAQNITNTLGSTGTFSIKDGTTNYFTLNQSTGNVSLFRNMELGGISNSTSTVGVITKNGVRFLHNYGNSNTFLGLNSGNFTMTGAGNSAFGYTSLTSITTGIHNSAFGTTALYSNTTGFDNSAFGYASFGYNTTGYDNSAFGTYSLYYNTTGVFNSAFGFNSGSNITTGSNNTSIGYDAQVPNGTANNQVRIGNTSVTYAGIQVAWTVTSDRNLKKNILSSNLGLGFINKLRPVSYIRKNDESEKTEYGLIAQEVEETLKQEGIENPAMLTVTESGEYQLRYNDLLAPMIKAIQELKAEKDTEIASLKTEKDNEIATLKKDNEMLKNQLNEIYKTVNELKLNRAEVTDIKLNNNGK